MDSGSEGSTRPDRSAEYAHTTINLEDWDDVYLIGDVHGCIDELEALLERIDPAPTDLLLFVGDLVRKGPDSQAVVDLVRSRPNCRSVRGNNEHRLVLAGRTEVVDADTLEYLESLPLVIGFDGALVVHGGIDPEHPIREQSMETLLTMRAVPPGNGYDGPFWFERYEGPPRVFFGHTVVEEPIVTEHAVALDTGCVYGGALTAYDYRADDCISVAALRDYQSRPDAKVLAGLPTQ